MASRSRPAPKCGRLESVMFVKNNENKEKPANEEIKAQKQSMTLLNKTENKQINTNNKAKNNTKDIKTKDVEAIIKEVKIICITKEHHQNSYMR